MHSNILYAILAALIVSTSAFLQSRRATTANRPVEVAVAPSTKGLHLENLNRITEQVREGVHADLQKHLSFVSPIAIITSAVKTLPRKLSSIFTLMHWISLLDFSILMLLLAAYKPILHKIFSLLHGAQNAESEYKASFLGFIEKPISYSLIYLPFLYILDLFSIIIHTIGFNFHLKGDLPRIIRTFAQCFIGGSWTTTIKDWYTLTIFRSTKTQQPTRDIIRDHTIDELSSLAIWFIFIGVAFEALRLEFGYTLGSIFALGGIGSASIIFALKDTMENLLGGILLKLNDKFRVGDSIAMGKGMQGKVSEISYLATTLLLEDNSVTNIPNKQFSSGEVTNWSRTEYRLFKTSLTIPISSLPSLPELINKIKSKVESIPEVEKETRSVQVVASGFDELNIVIDVNLHFKATKGIGALKSQVISSIAESVAAVTKGDTESADAGVVA